jgi:hypothetical protein
VGPLGWDGSGLVGGPRLRLRLRLRLGLASGVDVGWAWRVLGVVVDGWVDWMGGGCVGIDGIDGIDGMQVERGRSDAIPCEGD